MERLPLSGIRILDLTRLLPGPLCSQHLGDLGADVVKIEDTAAGDYAPAEMRALLNRNKRGLILDLKAEAGRDAFLRLAEGADAVIEGFRPGVMERLGIGHAALRARNPAIVLTSITGYGADGPRAALAGHDINYCALAGVADQVGTPAGDLALSNLPLADIVGGAMTAAMGTLAAVIDARATGRGRHVDIAMTEGVLAAAAMVFAGLRRDGRTPPTGGDTLSGALPCYGYYRTADGRHLAVGALEHKFWTAFCNILGRDDLAPLGRPADARTRAAVRRDLAAEIARFTLAEWRAKLAGSDCCVTPVLTLEEAIADPALAARGAFLNVDDPEIGRVVAPASPVRMDGCVFGLRRRPPRAGADSAQVLAEAGFSEAEIGSLARAGVLGPACAA
ncbi:MAG: CaiB/BaiF CoA transferase family protein [Pseudochelatococcus sp.]|jgi:alpha-methylacyl-CoA racemase|uniref:CaiB/BaiF CoA transferase family protein n=1 Tax=Pseudochelatococcus sp. TaxID=2020869 RepID=UPI003D8D62C4